MRTEEQNAEHNETASPMLTLPPAVLRTFVEQLDRRTRALAQISDSAQHETESRQLALAYLQLGRQMADSGCTDDALGCLRHALDLQPDNPELSYDILFKLERLNRHEEAWEILAGLETRLGPLFEVSRKLFILQARLEYRRGNLARCRAMLERFLTESPGHSHRYLAYGWLGTALDELGDYAAAMSAFNGKNESISSTPKAAELTRQNDDELIAIDASLNWYCQLNSFGWQATNLSDDLPDPIILVGFPRSGTTLLDQLLNAHSKLVTLEEKPSLAGIADRFFGSAARLEQLARLSDADIATYRQTYWKNISGLLNRPAGQYHVVDKLPLNIMHLDIFARLFPRVKIIVALRDPRDVLLSNYMQLYRLNASMAANLSLERAARYYAKVMQLYVLFRTFLPGNIHEIRYENLVLDLETEGTRLVNFLGLQWEEQQSRFHESARTQGIATPSYHQVIKPVYHSSIGRWRHYENHLQAVLPLLQPFIDTFGYSDSGLKS